MRRALRRASVAWLALVLGATLSGCGYHLSGKGSNLPAHVKIIAVPPFENQTTRPELGERITEKVIEALIRRGKYKMQADEKGADAVFRGVVLSWNNRPVSLTQETSDASRVAVTLRASVQLEDKVAKTMIWQQESYAFTAEYEVIGDVDQYFDTELSAVDKVADDFARAAVSAALQGF